MGVVDRLAQIASTGTTSGGGGGVGTRSGEFLAAAASLDLEAHPHTRIDMSASYPTFTTQGATHTYLPTGGWDGGPCAHITPVLTDQGYQNVGGFIVNKGGTFAIQNLYAAFECQFGSTQCENMLDQHKFVIVQTSPTVGGATADRPMYYLANNARGGELPGALADQQLMSFGVAQGTVKNFQDLTVYPTPDEDFPNYYPCGREPAYFGNSNTTISGKPIFLDTEWYLFELHMVSVAIPGYPNGYIRGKITSRSGAVVMDLYVPWTWDAPATLGSYFSQFEGAGGYSPATLASDPNNWMRLAGFTFIVGLMPGELPGPRNGFLL